MPVVSAADAIAEYMDEGHGATAHIMIDHSGWSAVPDGLPQWLYATPTLLVSEPMYATGDPCD